MVKTSIIISMYNSEKRLEECLDSVENQSLKDIEVIAINDGSTDRTLEIVESYHDKLPNLTVLNSKNYGAGHARNMGLDIAKGEYIKFLDSDDELSSPIILEKLYDIATSTDSDVIVGKYYTHLGKINLSGAYNTLGREKSGLIDLEKDKDYPFEEMPGIGDKFFKRSHIKNLRFSDTKWEDLAFTPVLMADAKKLYFLNETVYNYRMRLNNTSISGCVFANDVFDFFKVFNNLEENFKQRGIKEKYDKELLGLFSMHGHFDATYVPLWVNMSIKEKSDLLKYFITKMENHYPNFREDPIVDKYYQTHKPFKTLFDVADKLSTKSKITVNNDNIDTEINDFINNSKSLTKKR